MRDTNLLILFLFMVLVFSIVTLSGNLHAGPRLVDDNQIFKLDRDIRDQGFFETAREHFSDRIFRMGRLVPIYLVHKFLCIKVLGTQILHWSIYAALMGALAAFLLYLTGRQMGLTTVESVGFSLITVLGEQSVLWWRIMHGEGVGLLFLSVGLFCMAKGIKALRYRGLWDALFVVFVILASLSKESFIILIPAVCYWRLWLAQRHYGISLLVSLRRALFPVASLLIVASIELYYIYFVLGKTHFRYTGWKGFHLSRFVEISREFFVLDRAWIVAAAFAAVLVNLLWNAFSRNRKEVAVQSFARHLSGTMFLAFLIIVPQFLLYMSSGFSGRFTVSMARFLVPATMGLAVLVVIPMQLIREHTKKKPIHSETKDKVYRILVQIPVCAVLTVFLFQRLSVAYGESVSFARHTEERGRFFDSIRLNTKKDDTILIAYHWASAENTRRLTILLREYLHRDNVYYISVNRGGLFEDVRFNWPEKDFYSDMIDARSLPDAKGLGRIAAVLMVQGGIVEMPFLLQSRDWFDPLKYKRFQSELTDTAYYAADEKSVFPEDYYSLPTIMELTQWEIDQEGRMTIRGFGLSPTAIKKVTMSIDGNPIGPVQYPERMLAAYGEHPEYFNEYGGFSVQTPLVGPYVGEPVRVELIGDEGVIARQEFEANYAIPKDFDPQTRARILAPLMDSLETRLERSRPGPEQDNYFTFRGWALSPHTIDEIIVTVGTSASRDFCFHSCGRTFTSSTPNT